MSKNGPESYAEQFASIYNDVKNYPRLQDVATELGKSIKTVRNYSAILRNKSKNDRSLPMLISRIALKDRPKPNEMTKEELAEIRARTLSGEMTGLFQASKWPVTNPEAMVTAPSTRYRLDRTNGTKVLEIGRPRTWLQDTLRVAPIKNYKGRTFILTGAQNDTDIDIVLWENLKAYAEHLGADIVVGPWTYETSWWDENNPASRSYHSELEEYLCFGQMEIGEEFIFAGEMNTLPTATRPIGDLTTYSKGRWAVFPHPRLQLISMPAIDPGDQGFQIMTTGAVTKPQVIPRKAGIKSIDNHTMGATIVEFDSDGDIFARQITASPEDSSFQDLDTLVRNGRVYTGQSVEVLTVADMHSAKMGSKNALSTFGFDYKTGKKQKCNLIDELRPKLVVAHDIHDHESRNHHHREDVSHNYEMAYRGRESVEEEVQRSSKILDCLMDKDVNVLVVESNHDKALERYIREGRYRQDGINMMYGLKLDQAYHKWVEHLSDALDAEKDPGSFSLLEWAIRDMNPRLNRVTWSHDNGSYIVNGVQLGWHGDRGVNGTRGSLYGFSRMGHKITFGHTHTPGIMDGAMCGGVMELSHGYNKGPSAWCVTHVIQYPNGSRCLVTMQKGKYRLKRKKNGKGKRILK